MGMSICFDNIVFDLQNAGGISVVWYELLRRTSLDTNFNIRYIDNGGKNNPYRSKLVILENEIIKGDICVPLSRYSPVSIHDNDTFLFHSSYYRYCTNKESINITTVHDFIYDYYGHGLAKWVHCWQRNRAIRHSNYIVCISENTKKDLMKFLPDVDERKIRVIYNGVSDDYCVLSEQNSDNIVPFKRGEYVIYVGGRGGHKNFDLLKRVIAKSSFNLVIVGSLLSDNEVHDLEKYVPRERYYSTGFLPNKELNVLYNNAAALIYPSSYEGFGIPVIEAQKAGCPVVAFKGSSIKEIIGDTPLLMDELTEGALLKNLSLLSDDKLMTTVKENGLNNSARFSWDKMYKDYYQLYQEAITQHNEKK